MNRENTGFFHSPDDEELIRKADEEVFDMERLEELTAVGPKVWGVDHGKEETPLDRVSRRSNLGKEGIRKKTIEETRREHSKIGGLVGATMELARAAAQKRLEQQAA